jgi:hypothetical protein
VRKEIKAAAMTKGRLCNINQFLPTVYMDITNIFCVIPRRDGRVVAIIKKGGNFSLFCFGGRNRLSK